MGISIVPPGPADPVSPQVSAVILGKQTAPVAGTVIATTGVVPAGTYAVSITVHIAVAIAETDDDNMQLLLGAGVITGIPCVAADNVAVSVGPINVATAGGAAFTVNAVANATATAVYTAFISATKVG
jgi:hypothetical protein